MDISESVRTRIEALTKQAAVKREVFDVQIKNIEYAIKQIQEECPHIHTKYHPDPSGNNDSWADCEDCGAELE